MGRGCYRKGIPTEISAPPYTLANGWNFFTVDNFALDAQGNHLELGIAPDIYVEMDENNPGVDEIPERALFELRK